MRTKVFHSFEQKLHYFEDDLELIDILCNCVRKGDLTDSNSEYLIKRLDPSKHCHISRRSNSYGSRKNVINHLRHSIYSSYVKDVYEEVTDYLKVIIALSIKNGVNSGRLIGEHSFNINANDLLALGRWRKVCEVVAERLLQSLEAERSTLQLLKKATKKLGLNIDSAVINNAVKYLEIRHFLVHTGGKLSQEYINKNPTINKNSKGVIVLDYALIIEFRDSIKVLMKAFDDEIINKKLVNKSNLMR